MSDCIYSGYKPSLIFANTWAWKMFAAIYIQHHYSLMNIALNQYSSNPIYLYDVDMTFANLQTILLLFIEYFSLSKIQFDSYISLCLILSSNHEIIYFIK